MQFCAYLLALVSQLTNVCLHFALSMLVAPEFPAVKRCSHFVVAQSHEHELEVVLDSVFCVSVYSLPMAEVAHYFALGLSCEHQQRPQLPCCKCFA